MADIPEELVASLAKTLNSDGVPCILWGECLLNIHGISSPINSIDFIVPTGHINEADKSLNKFPGLHACTKQPSCPWSPKKRKAEEPVIHMHLDNTNVTVALYAHCRILWFIPEMGNHLTLDEQHTYLLPHLTVASNAAALPPCRPGRGPGVFTTAEYPVIVPRLHLLMEAFMRLYLRDSKKREGAYAIEIMERLIPCMDDADHPGSSKIPERIKKHYEALRRGDRLGVGRGS